MDSQSNPYTPPRSDQLATSLLLAHETVAIKQRRVAAIIFAFAVGIAALFTALDDVIVQARIGPWPIIFGSAILSLLSSFLTRDRLMAPLTCFGAIMTSDLMVAITHDLSYAQMHVALPIAIAFSVPALLITSWLRK